MTAGQETPQDVLARAKTRTSLETPQDEWRRKMLEGQAAQVGAMKDLQEEVRGFRDFATRVIVYPALISGLLVLCGGFYWMVQ